MPRLTWVIPCFNEASRIDAEAFLRLAVPSDSVVADIHVLLIDDGSSDTTVQVLDSLCARSKGRARLQRLDRNQGKGEAVRQGMLTALASGAEQVGYLDADLSTPVDEALRLGKELALRPHVQALLGSRVRLLGTDVVRSPWRHYLGRLFATAASLTLGLAVYDTQCGAKLFRSTPALNAALQERFLSRWIFDVELIGRLLGQGVPQSAIHEEPLRVWRDVRGSKLTPLGMLRALIDLARVWRRLGKR